MNLSNNSYPPTPQVLHDFVPMPSSQEEAEAARRNNFVQLQMNNVQLFWNKQLLEIHNTSVSRSCHQLPLARVKRIMKSNGVVKMISSETPILFSKACELFIMELTLRAWLQTEASKRRTLQKCDIAEAIRNDQLLHNFLAPIVLCTLHDHEGENENEVEILGDPSSMSSAPGFPSK
ncbi:nuclear transcription factor Y subunit C-1 [Rosa sericea]